MTGVIYELQLQETKADYVTFTGNPKNPHLPGIKIMLPTSDWPALGRPETIDVMVGLQYSATEPSPSKARGKKK